MPMTMRVSLSGYDCLTDGTIDHYSVYADSDNILIKEFSRGTINISAGANGTVAHNLGYIPFFLTYRSDGGTRSLITGASNNSSFNTNSYTGTANLVIADSGGSATFNYFIFYDKGTAL